MCEFCPTVGRCAVCDHVTVAPYVPLKAKDLLPPEHQSTSSDEGFLVSFQGVKVRFDRHRDAMACLKQYPQAEVL